MTRTLKIPHMGWNELTVIPEMRRTPVLAGHRIAAMHVYFVHSYHLVPDQPGMQRLGLDRTMVGPVTAAVGRDNIVGTQFHPEKSQARGPSDHHQLFAVASRDLSSQPSTSRARSSACAWCTAIWTKRRSSTTSPAAQATSLCRCRLHVAAHGGPRRRVRRQAGQCRCRDRRSSTAVDIDGAAGRRHPRYADHRKLAG